jgi:hypothetical protein
MPFTSSRLQRFLVRLFAKVNTRHRSLKMPSASPYACEPADVVRLNSGKPFRSPVLSCLFIPVRCSKRIEFPHYYLQNS